MAEIKVTIDLNFKFLGLDGQPFKSQNIELAPANKIVANFLYTTSSPDKSDKLKNRLWAQKLYEEGTLEIDKRGIDAILAICAQAQMLDGLYCQLDDYLTDRKDHWDKLKAANPA
jgi:hypothetical protein